MFAAPALADVTISMAQVGDTNEVIISITSTETNLIRAYGLDIKLTQNTAVPDSDPDPNILEVTALNEDYWVFPGRIQIDPDGNITDLGSPDAEYADLPSDTLAGLDSNGVTVELASLYYPVGPTSPNKPVQDGALLSVKVSGSACITVTANVSRAGASGVVMEDPGEVVTVNIDPPTLCIVVDEGCFNSGHPDYAEWANVVGKPTSWCYKYQCYGDADGINNGNPFTGYSRVRVEDLNILISGWKVEDYVDEETHPWIAADFDRTLNGNPFTGYSRVRVEDLNILVANWKDDSGIPMENPNCGGDIDLTP
jgi:hypothetical protein